MQQRKLSYQKPLRKFRQLSVYAKKRTNCCEADGVTSKKAASAAFLLYFDYKTMRNNYTSQD
jgi:hypothetical protein